MECSSKASVSIKQEVKKPLTHLRYKRQWSRAVSQEQSFGRPVQTKAATETVRNLHYNNETIAHKWGMKV